MYLSLILPPSEVWSVPFLNSKILGLVNFQALDPKFHLALEPKVLKLEGSYFLNNPSIYVLKGCYEEPPKSTENSPPPLVIIELNTTVNVLFQIWVLRILASLLRTNPPNLINSGGLAAY